MMLKALVHSAFLFLTLPVFAAGVAPAETFPIEGEAIYRALKVHPDWHQDNTETRTLVKKAGRLSCFRAFNKDNPTASRYGCILDPNFKAPHDEADVDHEEETFTALAVKAVITAPERNFLHFTKTIGRLSCTRRISRVTDATIGYSCVVIPTTDK